MPDSSEGKPSALGPLIGCTWFLVIIALAVFTVYRGWPWSWWWIGIFLAALGWQSMYQRINAAGESYARLWGLIIYLVIAIGCAIGCIVSSYYK
jgi:hypothetical protein